MNEDIKKIIDELEREACLNAASVAPQLRSISDSASKLSLSFMMLAAKMGAGPQAIIVASIDTAAMMMAGAPKELQEAILEGAKFRLEKEFKQQVEHEARTADDELDIDELIDQVRDIFKKKKG